MLEVFPHVNSNRIQEGHSKLKTSVEFHALENRSQGKLSYFIKTSNTSCISSGYAERA